MLMRTAKQDLGLSPFDLKMVEAMVYGHMGYQAKRVVMWSRGPKPQSLDKDWHGWAWLSLSLFLSKASLCRVASAIRSAFLKAKFEREQAAAASKAPEHKAGIWEGRNILGRSKYAIRPVLSSTRRMKKHHESPRAQVKMKGAFRDLADADQKLETWRYCSWFVQDVQATVGYVTPRDHEADYGFGGHGMNMASQDCYHNSKSSILIGFSIIKPSVRPPRPWARTGLPPPSPAPHPPLADILAVASARLGHPVWSVPIIFGLLENSRRIDDWKQVPECKIPRTMG